MGKIFSTSTWRAPLQLLDCWLPLPSERRLNPALPKRPGNVVRRFAQAGWLQREAANSLPEKAEENQASHGGASANCPIHVLRPSEARQPAPRDTRLVISGSMSDVCAELDRLATLEKKPAARTA